MKRMVVLLLFLPALVLAQAARADDLPSQGLMVTRLDAYLSDAEDNNAGIGSVSIFKDGREVYHRSFGQKNQPDVAWDENTPYQIASVTKMVTAILAFKLIENGRMTLDDRLSDFFPDMPSAQKISIGHLLAHTSGLGNYAIKDGAIWVVDPVSEEAILKEIKRQGVAFEPGTGTAYSNSAYYLLAKIIEQRNGRAYHEIVAQEIARPLGLKHFASAGAPAAATFKSYAFDGQWREIKEIKYSNVVGVGDISSTTHDLNTLILGLFQHRILGRTSVEQMKPFPGNDGWGRGLAEFTFGGRHFLGHGGDVLGSHARVIYNLEDGVAIAYATNGERIPTNVFLNAIVGLVYGDDVIVPSVDQRQDGQ